MRASQPFLFYDDVKRSFKVIRIKSRAVCLVEMQPVSVDVMELTTWPSASETPSDCDSLLQLIHLVAQRQRQHRSTPVAEASRNRPSSVVVQCL